MNNRAEELFPNENIYKTNVDIPDTFLTAINQIPNQNIGKTPEEQQQAKKTIKNWVVTLWQGIEFSLSLQKIKPEQILAFKIKLEQNILDFISHTDHGIIHAFYVYKGMLHLAKREGKPITPGSDDDKQAQLMALMHDIVQTLSFTIGETKFKKRYSHTRNDHAQIIGDLTKIFGKSFGFNSKRTQQIAFGLIHHDASYQDKYYYNEFDYLSKLLHDSDKVFGASIDKDPQSITDGMLDRNYQANKGAGGSYVFREKLNTAIRDLIVYGDRYFSDAISLVIKEFRILMYTQSGQEIALQRIDVVRQSISKIYGKYFNLTYDFINDEIAEYFNGNRPSMKLSIVGMDQKEKPLLPSITTMDQFKEEINKLYKTPIHLNNEKQFISRYGKDHARGLKIHVFDPTTNTKIYLDPSIARYCFKPEGKEEFLTKITTAFEEGIGLAKDS